MLIWSRSSHRFVSTSTRLIHSTTPLLKQSKKTKAGQSPKKAFNKAIKGVWKDLGSSQEMDSILKPLLRPTPPSFSSKLRRRKTSTVATSTNKLLSQRLMENSNFIGNIFVDAPSEGVQALKGAGVPQNDMVRGKKGKERMRENVNTKRNINTEPKVSNDEWGEDKLKPTTAFPSVPIGTYSKIVDKRLPPHISEYSRRIEGLLEPSIAPVLQDLTPIYEHREIATLSHGLDRVLFNPGIHWLRDPRSRVYNFTPWLENVPKVQDFAFERLTPFVASSQDDELWRLAKQENRTYAGSTSSLSGVLSQIYFLISADKEVDTSILSSHFRSEPKTFTPGQRMPVSVILNYKDGVYGIDSEKEEGEAEKNILTWMGTLLERFLTSTPEEFSTVMRATPVQEPVAEVTPIRDAYRFSKSNRFVMRSQLDCHDRRLPGTGVFDIKTRACAPVRMDILSFEENSGYLIKTLHGQIESFEKEYYDLIRSAFLKYSFQVRIGNMDGVIVAYHNTAQLFGFQYVPLSEIDERLFGTGEGVGERVFEKCIGLMEKVMDDVTRCIPGQSLRCTFDTIFGGERMYVFVEPAVWDGLPEEKPLKQLEVRVTSFVGDDASRGNRAMSSCDEPWTMYYSISEIAASPTSIATALADTELRKIRGWVFPAGVQPEELEVFWREKLNFGSYSSGEAAKVKLKPGGKLDLTQFRHPSAAVEWLRSVAQSGKEETERMRKMEEGKEKVVLETM